LTGRRTWFEMNTVHLIDQPCAFAKHLFERFRKFWFHYTDDWLTVIIETFPLELFVIDIIHRDLGNRWKVTRVLKSK
jgi:hypothetical protein